jgi:hypothetical protein
MLVAFLLLLEIFSPENTPPKNHKISLAIKENGSSQLPRAKGNYQMLVS